MSEMKADLLGVLEGASRIARDVADLRTLADHALRELDSPLNLPPPALTEAAVYQWLRDDPSRMGRMMPAFAVGISTRERYAFGEAAREVVSEFSDSGAKALQSLAVALAAASYRG